MSEAPPISQLGRYEIVRELGKGAMGVVYEGKDPRIGRRVAIKTARRDLLANSGHADELMERFLREAKAAGTLNHPNIITIYDADEEDGLAYIAMEFIDGGDLRQWVLGRTQHSIEQHVELIACLAEALAFAHDQGVIHRDVKPANILLPKGGEPKLADFGIARTADSQLTQEGAMIGTPHYMSPEQFMGQRVDGRSDLFSLGVILYELLTGEKPFGGDGMSAIMHRVIKVEPVAPQALALDVPEALGGVVMKSLAKKPNARYRDGRALAAALRESLKENPDLGVLALDPGSLTHEETQVIGSATVAMRPDDQATRLGSQVAEREPTQANKARTLAGPHDETISPTAVGAHVDKPNLQKKLIPLGVGGAIVVLIAAYALFAGFFGGERTDESPDTPAVASDTPVATDSPPTPPVAAGPMVERVRLNIVGITDPLLDVAQMTTDARAQQYLGPWKVTLSSEPLGKGTVYWQSLDYQTAPSKIEQIFTLAQPVPMPLYVTVDDGSADPPNAQLVGGGGIAGIDLPVIMAEGQAP